MIPLANSLWAPFSQKAGVPLHGDRVFTWSVAVAASPAVVDFFVYENWQAGPHKAVLHRSNCGQCNHGKGRPAGHDPLHASWHGPYPTVGDARQALQAMPNVLIRSECKCV